MLNSKAVTGNCMLDPNKEENKEAHDENGS